MILLESRAMADTHYMKLANDAGVSSIKVSFRKLFCIGASEPFDHPHIFLDMGGNDRIVCPYCSTLFIYDSKSE